MGTTGLKFEEIRLVETSDTPFFVHLLVVDV